MPSASFRNGAFPKNGFRNLELRGVLLPAIAAGASVGSVSIALNSGRVVRWVAWTSAVAVATIGTVDLLGWIFDQPRMVSYVAASIPLQFNTAVCLLLCGIAVIAILMERRTLAMGLAAMVMVIAGMCAVEIFLAPNSGVMRMFFDASARRLRQMPLAPNSAIALLLACTSIALLGTGRARRVSSAIAAVIAAGIAAFGAMSLGGYVVELSSAYRWGEMIPMSIPAAMGVVACGLSIVAAAWASGAEGTDALPNWTPLALLSALGTASVLLFSSLQVDPSLTRTWPVSQRQALFVNAVATLVLGFGTSIALAVALALVRRIELRSRQLQAANSELDGEVARRRVAQTAVERLNRALNTVSACRQAIAKSETETELLDRICDIAVSAGGYQLVWIGIADHDEARNVHVVAKAGVGTEYLQDGFVTWADEPRGRGPTGTAIRTGAPCVCNDTLSEETFLPWRERALQFGFRSSLVVPLLGREKAFGAISIYAPETQAFGDDETELFVQLASDLCFGIDSIRTRTERRRAEAATRASEERYRCLTLATAQIVWMTDPNGFVCGDMPSWRSFTGMTLEQIQGQGWLDSLRPDDRERTSKVWEAAVASRSLYETEYRIRRADGEFRHVWVRGVPVLEKSGEIREWVGTCTDITERKSAQEEMARFAEELQRSNAELQDFAFVASHDLQEPLRKITAFSDRLRDRCAAQLDETGLDFLNRMHSAATRMARLIDSLLDYSRLSTRALPFADVDLATICAGVLADLEQRLRETGARVLVRTLPRVMGDSAQLRQLLQNLLGNALKFHAAGVRPEIRVQSLERNGRWEISVTDNGIGFDPAYTDRIFRPFQRLHGRSEYEGSGMGLAICRKIAQRHGADIQVESQPGKGSTFTVSLPESAEFRALRAEYRTAPVPAEHVALGAQH